MNKKFILATLCGVALSLGAEEVSVFDAGNLDKSEPYGLTQNEKTILKNRQNIGAMQSDVSDAKENIEGIKSVLDGVNANMQKLSGKVSDLENAHNQSDYELKQEIAKLKKANSDQDAKIKKLTAALAELGALIDAKNSATNSNLNNVEPKSENKKDAKATDNVKADNSNLNSKEPNEILSIADKAYKSKDYKKAKEAYELLVSKNHKPAYANFMLGEVEYAKKNYKNAIPYYQSSVSLYDKGNYMPKLLYHTAISFDKTGDRANANKFYTALKQAHPESEEAKVAPTRK